MRADRLGVTAAVSSAAVTRERAPRAAARYAIPLAGRRISAFRLLSTPAGYKTAMGTSNSAK